MKWLEIEMETVSLGAVALPNVLFMTYFMQHSRQAVAALPVIMFYVMVKTVPYALRSFGKVQNPLRLLRCSWVVALLGALLATGTPLVAEGAIMVGMGLASVQPAYQQTKDHFKQTGAWPAFRAGLAAIGWLLVALVVGFVLSTVSFSWFALELAVLLALAAVFAWWLPSWNDQPIFTGPWRLRPAIATLLILLMTLGARGLKQTGDQQLIWLTLAMWLIMLGGFPWLQRRVNASRLWTFLTGAVVNFLLIYGLFYFSVRGEYGLLYASYGLFILGMVGGFIVLRPLRKYSWLVTVLILAASLLTMMIPNSWSYLVGMLVASCCCSVINTAIWPTYARDIQLAGHARFTRQYYNILGSIISQVTLISLLVVCNYLFNRHTNQLLAAYYQHRAVTGLNDPLWLSRVGCLLFLLVLLAVAVSQQLRQVDKD